MHFDIVVGSVLGASEYVAEEVQNYLTKKGYIAHCHFNPCFESLKKDSVIIVVTSTHGAGELPDNIQSFAEQTKTENLIGREVIIIGLGDSSYDTFCAGAITMQTLLEEAGAKLRYDPLHIDVLHHPIPEDLAVQWIKKQDF